MVSLGKGNIGILSTGALGVSLFYHLTNQLQDLEGKVYFLERPNSSSGIALRKAGKIIIVYPQGQQSFSTDIWLKPDFITCYKSGYLPEIVLICTNPDQLLAIISGVVDLLVLIYEREGFESLYNSLPLFVLCSNGIYFQRFRQVFIEKLEEATLFGYLPDLWPTIMPQIVGHLLRGVTIQTGIREGHGTNTIYRPGFSGKTVITGGDAETRERCHQILASRGAWFENGGLISATRLEFDKALINLTFNLLGQLYSIDAQGKFTRLTVGQILQAENIHQIRELAGQVFRVGKGVKVYQKNESYEVILQQFLETCKPHQDHIPSSLQWVDIKLRLNELEAKVTPTESWLIEPLMRYAKACQLEETAEYFQSLKEQLIQKLTLAIHFNTLNGTITL